MPGSHDWRTRAASQITQQLPDNTAGPLAVRDAAVRHIWPKAEYERALDLINRGYDKLIVAQIIGRPLKELNNKLHYEQMVESGNNAASGSMNSERGRSAEPLTRHARIIAYRLGRPSTRRQSCSRRGQPGRRQSIAT